VELVDTGEGSGLEVTAEGEGATRVPPDARNLIYRARERVFERRDSESNGEHSEAEQHCTYPAA